MPASHLTPAALEFLKELRTHNDRDWFQSHKSRYETELRDPFLRLIADLGPGLRKIHGSFIADPSPNGGSMMRIYRDTRFSKDKSPYKTHVAAYIRHARGREGGTPGYYLHIEPGSSMIGGGVWRPEPGALRKIREQIAAKPKAWKRVSERYRRGSGWSMEGETLQRPPAGYAANHPLIDDIKRRDFVVVSSLTDEEVCGNGFQRLVLARFRSIAPFLQFLADALGLP